MKEKEIPLQNISQIETKILNYASNETEKTVPSITTIRIQALYLLVNPVDNVEVNFMNLSFSMC